YNWTTGKSEKCILCFPRMETGQAPACAHSCVGRIRYMGVLLYDADRIADMVARPADELLDAQLDIILDPRDDRVVTAARAAGIDDGWIDAARRSPVYRFVKDWGMALPLHPEYRTAAMMFYIPPLSPVISTIERNLVRLDLPDDRVDFELMDELDKARLPVRYLANLFSDGDERPIRDILSTMLAVRGYKRRQSVDGSIDESTLAMLDSVGLTEDRAEDIYRLTTMPTVEERFVFPPYHREMSIEALDDPLAHKGGTGFGYVRAPKRGA
ncbi:MAG: 4Fe-4S dicluster domain-containing protein, partial [Acidimicrobiales bacterium]